ncbi:MAG: HisA/HisF-related TIM barrel protein [Nitrososphaerota archaeon]|nr:HisA/HisF-related TIM barrel protein [Nitrososphaerales archaeon]MDW8044693.1 HisA/HisF-related TIM barrel protein [Nitrososphaerota archaeon]
MSVIDIMRGKAVHAIGGKRDEYQPIRSPICATSNPIDIAKVFKDLFNLDELYVADLDAIMGRGSNLGIISRICSEVGMKVMLDSGINNASHVDEIFDAGVSKLVLGTESMTTINHLRDLIGSFGGEQIVPSIDVVDGKVISKCMGLMGERPARVAMKLESMGVVELILLDISRVGTERGVDMGLVREVVNAVRVPVLVGGGIRSLDDILCLKKEGASGVLVATALHKGALTKDDIEKVMKV